MAEMILPIAAFIGLAHAAPQGLNLGNPLGAVTTSTTQTVVPIPVVGGGNGGAGGVPGVSILPIPTSIATVDVANPGGIIQSVTQGLPEVATPGLPAASVPAVSLPAAPSVGSPNRPSVAVPGLPSTALPAVPSLATPALPSLAAPSLPSVAAPALPSVSAPGLPSVLVPGLPSTALPGAPSVAAPGLPSVSVPGLPSVAVPGLPTTALPGAPSVAVPGLPTTALPDVPSFAVPGLHATALPALPAVDPASLTLPVILQTSLPTGSVLPVDIKTLVPLVNIDIIATPASLPANAAATGAIASAPASVPPSASGASLPSSSLPSLSNVTSILESVTSDALVKVMSAVASALAQVASIAGGSLPTPGAALPSSVLSALENLPTEAAGGAVGSATGLAAGAAPTASPTIPTFAATLPNATLSARARQEAESGTQDFKDRRQASALTGLLSGGTSPLAGIPGAVGSLTSGAGLGAAAGGLTANNAIVGNVANAVHNFAGGATTLTFLSPLLGSTGGVAGLSAVLAGSPVGSIITNPGGIPSMVLSTTKDIPILAPLSFFTSGVKSAATLRLTDDLATLPVIANILRSAISTMSTFGLYNVDPFTQLVPLTNVAALQTAIRFINPKDLVLASYILGSKDVLSSNVLGSMLQDPTQLIHAISAAAPVADNLPALASLLVLGNLGATGMQNLVGGIDRSAVQTLLAKIPVGTLPTGAATSALPVKE